ncbi:MAG: HAD family hydrolase [Pseudohongiellaceae bacterium]
MNKTLRVHTDNPGRASELRTGVDCVLFDLDGTLVDTAPDFLIAVNQLMTEKKRAAVAETAIRQTVSDGARALIRLAFAMDEQHPEFPTLLQRLLDLYLVQLEQTRARLYDGLDYLLQQLERKAIPWGIVTNKPEPYAQLLLSKLELLSACGSLVCPEHVSERKPDPEPILLACKQLGCKTERTVYFGDHERDMIAAKNADVIAIAATYGYLGETARPELWPADFFLHHPTEAVALLNLLQFSSDG